MENVHNAELNVSMRKGDMPETDMNINFTCRLLMPPMHIISISCINTSAVSAQLTHLVHLFNQFHTILGLYSRMLIISHSAISSCISLLSTTRCLQRLLPSCVHIAQTLHMSNGSLCQLCAQEPACTWGC